MGKIVLFNENIEFPYTYWKELHLIRTEEGWEGKFCNSDDLENCCPIYGTFKMCEICPDCNESERRIWTEEKVYRMITRYKILVAE